MWWVWTLCLGGKKKKKKNPWNSSTFIKMRFLKLRQLQYKEQNFAEMPRPVLVNCLWSQKLCSSIMQCFPFHQCSLVQAKHQTCVALSLHLSCVLSSRWAAMALCSALWTGLNFYWACSTSSASKENSVCLRITHFCICWMGFNMAADLKGLSSIYSVIFFSAKDLSVKWGCHCCRNSYSPVLFNPYASNKFQNGFSFIRFQLQIREEDIVYWNF